MGKCCPRRREVCPAHALLDIAVPSERLQDWSLTWLLTSFSSYFLTKKSPSYQQNFTGFTGEKSGFSLIWNKKDAERWEKNLVFAFFLSLCKPPNTSFLKGPISTETKW